MLSALVFGAIFLMVFASLSGFVLSQNRLQDAKAAQLSAFHVAEAGLEYYRWFLSHFPDDLTNKTGTEGPYVMPYEDPEQGVIGEFSLDVVGNTLCGEITSVDLFSTGHLYTHPSIEKTIRARYARPSVAGYSYVINENVWAGDDRIISGPYHSNGGVRMDGEANAPVTSSLLSWLCTSGFGCSPSGTVAGVFGDGGNQHLWSYPVPQIDFSAISANFSNLKSIAQSEGLYFAPQGGASNSQRGYELRFNANGTVTVYRIARATWVNMYPLDGSGEYPQREYSIPIAHGQGTGQGDGQGTILVGTYTIPEGCPLIFVEDRAWVSGTIQGKVTVVIADVTTSGYAPDAYLRNNITYTTTAGTDGLTLIAERNVLITPDSPQNMTLHGIFVAQNGAFGRNLYTCAYPDYDDKGTLTLLGTTVSNKRTGTQWTYSGFGCGNNRISGYHTRVDAYDRRLSTDPPPFTPATSPDYRFVEWREE